MLISFSIITLIIFILFSILRNLSKKRHLFSEETDLPKNMTFHVCPQHNNNQGESRCLAVLSTWLLAQEKHLAKFTQLWHKRGFDVLIVRTTPLDVLIPPFGSRLISKNVLKVLLKLKNNYESIIGHNFSVGCYQGGEFLVELFKSTSLEHTILISLVKGVVNDSLVLPIDASKGVSKTITSIPMIQILVEKTMSLFLSVFHNITVKCYNESLEASLKPCWKKPVLFFYSKDDELVDIKNLENFILASKESGASVRVKFWDQSGHMSNYKNYPDEYAKELDDFLEDLIPNNNNKF